MGGWRPPRGEHPAPLGLDILLLVTSPGFDAARWYPWMQSHPVMAQGMFDLPLVEAEIRRRIAGLAAGTWGEISAGLASRFHVVEA